MRIPFAVRIGLAIGILTVGSTGAVTGLFYYIVSGDTWEQMRAHVRSLAHTSSYMFTAPRRQQILSLNTILLSEGTRAIPALEPGDTAQSLADDEVGRLQSSNEFLAIAQILRRIKLGSSDEAQPEGFLSQRISHSSPPRIRFAYVVVPIPASPDFKLVRFIADGDYEELDENRDGKIEEDEQATSIGEVYNVEPQDGLRAAMKGVPSANSSYTEDKWGVWISGFAPILDEQGRVMAVLGIDYAARGEFDRLRSLRNFCLLIIAASLLLSAAAAIFISRWFTKPMIGLRAGADEVSKGNTHVQVQIGSRARDELTDLAESFNSMVSQVRAALEDQKEAISALVKTAKLRDEFLSNFSHELNTPIASLMAALELLQEGTISADELPDTTKDMLKDVMRLHSLVSNMLMVSKIEADTIDVVPVTLDAAAEVRRALARADASSSARVSGAAALEVRTDAELLQIALTQIIRNAMLHGAASQDAPFEVHIGRSGNECRIVIADNGPGVPLDQLRRLGEKYFRVDSSLTYARQGTGLGLYIARRLIEKLGGRLLFEGGKNGGLVCTVCLPL